MDDIKNREHELERELAEMETTCDDQKRLLSKSIKMLAGTLEMESPAAMQGKKRDINVESINELHHGLGELEGVYRSYTMERESQTERIREALGGWIRQIRAQLPDEETASLDKIESRLDKACENYGSLTSLLTALLDLQRRMLVGDDAATELDDNEASPAVESQHLPVDVLVSLKRVLQLLPLDDRGRVRAEELAQAVDHPLNSEELVGHLKQIVSLLEQRDSSAVDEVADFLKSLARQLGELQNELRESREQSAVFESKEAEHTEQISRGFEDIQASLSKAATYEEMKTVVSSQLETLVDSFAEFKKNRQERLDALEARYSKVLKHLAAVEGDATTAREAINAERQRAMTDHLTELPNRRAYEEHLKAELHRWARYKTVFSVLIVDIDHFKKINDTLGHLVGDRALKLVSKVLRKQLRDSDMIARYGGEEFVAVLAESEIEAAQRTADKLRRAVEKAPFKYGGELVNIRVSVGVTQVKEKDTVFSLFERADKALYRAKQAGRNRVEVG